MLVSSQNDGKQNPLFADDIYFLHYDEIVCNEEVHLLSIFAISEDQKEIFSLVRDFVLDSFENKTGTFKDTKYTVLEDEEGEVEEIIEKGDPQKDLI
jgi:hypothetical protein